MWLLTESSIRLTVQVLAVQLPIQLAANVPGRAAGDDTSVWVPLAHSRNLHSVPGSWLQIGPAQCVVATCE